jgi:hypothetical protein
LWDRVQARLDYFGRKPSEGRRRGLFSRALTSSYLFSGLLKCGEYGGNLVIGTGGGTHVHKKYVCTNYFNRGACENDLYIRRDVLEERLLGRLQSELLQPEVIDYAVSEFGRQLRTALAALSDDLAAMAGARNCSKKRSNVSRPRSRMAVRSILSYRRSRLVSWSSKESRTAYCWRAQRRSIVGCVRFAILSRRELPTCAIC